MRIAQIISFLLNERDLEIPVLKCDIEKDDIKTVTRRAKVIINCTGPNTLFSVPIVKACIETKTHYVDISAELYHMINLYRNYHKSAEEANVIIVPACGFAVMPVTTGLMFLEKKFNGTLNSVDCYTEVLLPKRAYIPGPNKCLVHYGTWESLVHELKNMRAYQRIKKDTFTKKIDDPVPQETKTSIFHRNNGRLWFIYPGPDKDVVDMSQLYLQEKKRKKPYHYQMYTTMPHWFHFIVVPFMYLYFYLCQIKWFRHLLWKYPCFFTVGYMSHKEPSKEMVDDTKFAMTFTGTGLDTELNKKQLTVQVSGSDPGYKTTSMLLIIAALTVLTKSENIPRGGVLFPNAAFEDTQIVEDIIKLKALNIKWKTMLVPRNSKKKKDSAPLTRH